MIVVGVGAVRTGRRHRAHAQVKGEKRRACCVVWLGWMGVGSRRVVLGGVGGDVDACVCFGVIDIGGL